MARVPDPQVRRRWRRLIESFDPQRFTVAEFCRCHQISHASFYKWRRVFADDAPQSQALARSTTPDTPSQATNAFVPVQIVDASAQPTPKVEVHLPGGVRIDVPADQQTLLWELIANLPQTQKANA